MSFSLCETVTAKINKYGQQTPTEGLSVSLKVAPQQEPEMGSKHFHLNVCYWVIKEICKEKKWGIFSYRQWSCLFVLNFLSVPPVSIKFKVHFNNFAEKNSFRFII